MKLNNFKLSDKLPEQDMQIVHIFFADVQPVFFLTKDNGGHLYIVTLCDDREELRWIVSPVKRSDIRKMLLNEITPHELFMLSRGWKSIIITRKNNFTDMKYVYLHEIDPLDLPTEDMYFEADLDEIVDYVKDMSVFDKTKREVKVTKTGYIEQTKRLRSRFYERRRENAYSYA